MTKIIDERQKLADVAVKRFLVIKKVMKNCYKNRYTLRFDQSRYICALVLTIDVVEEKQTSVQDGAIGAVSPRIQDVDKRQFGRVAVHQNVKTMKN